MACHLHLALFQGTQTREKNELLSQQFGIEYNSLPVIFRMGSSVFRLKVLLLLSYSKILLVFHSRFLLL